MGLRPARDDGQGEKQQEGQRPEGRDHTAQGDDIEPEQLHHDPQRERGLPLTGDGAQQQGPEQGPVSQPEDKGRTGYPREDKKKA